MHIFLRRFLTAQEMLDGKVSINAVKSRHTRDARQMLGNPNVLSEFSFRR